MRCMYCGADDHSHNQCPDMPPQPVGSAQDATGSDPFNRKQIEAVTAIRALDVWGADQYIVVADWSKLKPDTTAMGPTLTVARANAVTAVRTPAGVEPIVCDKCQEVMAAAVGLPISDARTPAASEGAWAMEEHSLLAWNIASRYSSVLASETRDLAAAIDAVIDERDADADAEIQRLRGLIESLKSDNAELFQSVTVQGETIARMEVQVESASLHQKGHTLALLKIAGALSQVQLAEESTSDEVTRRHLREIISSLTSTVRSGE